VKTSLAYRFSAQSDLRNFLVKQGNLVAQQLIVLQMLVDDLLQSKLVCLKARDLLRVRLVQSHEIAIFHLLHLTLIH